MIDDDTKPLNINPLLWPIIAAATASDAVATYFNDLAHAAIDDPVPPELCWTTPNRTVLELTTVRLRDFSTGSDGVPTLICAPFALHGATIADFAPGHSLVETLRDAGLTRVFVTEWRSASPEMRWLSIDSYLADLNVAVDELGAPVDLIGLCQGGWMALIYAARFPAKVRRLVLAGAPVDIRAAESYISDIARRTPLLAFDELVRLGGGLVLGQRVLKLFGSALVARESSRALQLPAACGAAERRALETRFNEWYASTVDLPGTYYLQVVSWLFMENRIAEGSFVALGRKIDLSRLDIPVFLIAGREDSIVSANQLLATAHLVGTPKEGIETVVEPCGHLSLFFGRQTLPRVWPRVADWLERDLSIEARPPQAIRTYVPGASARAG